MPTVRQFDSGQLIHVQAIFYDSSDTAADPAVVKFSYRAAALGITTTYTYGVGSELVKLSTGTYYVNINSYESTGQYEWNFYSTGDGQTADHDYFYIRPTTAI